MSASVESMDERERHLNRIKLAEHQFRLACTVNFAVAIESQPLDVPVEWSYGNHNVSYEEFGLRPDQAPIAASQLEMTATCVIAGAIRDAICELFPQAKAHANSDVVSAYQISRHIRNAFSHSMIDPKWSIDKDCINKTYDIDGVISLCTTGIHAQGFDWRIYGGPLAMFRFGRFVREILLQDPIEAARKKPDFPKSPAYQFGRTIFRKVSHIPDKLQSLSLKPGERIELGGGYYLLANNETITGTTE